jgi:type I restriction enzyme S subunit
MVPANWKATELGEIAKFSSGGTPSKENADFWGGIHPWITAKDLKQHYLKNSIDTLTDAGLANAKLAPAGASLILVRGMTLLKDFPVGYVTRPMSFNQDIKALIPEKEVDGLFFSFFLASQKEKMRQLVSIAGHGTGRLDTESIKSFPVNLPSLGEQKKIAKILVAWDQAITATEKLLANRLQQKNALVQQLLSGKKRIPGFNDPWVKYKFRDLLYEIKKDVVNNPKDYELLSVKLHCKGVVRTGKYPAVTEGGRPYFIRNEDELIIGRQNLHNGGIGIVPKEVSGCIASNAISSFGVHENVSIIFMLYMMSRPLFFTQIDNLIGGTGQKEISVNELFKLKVKIPSFKEQQQIARILTTSDREIEALQQKLACLKQEKKALMQQLLTGKRRVKVDES